MTALALLPERRALTWTASRQQQRAGRVFAEARGEERRPVQLRSHELAHFLRIEEQVVDIRCAVGLRKPQREAVVRVNHLDLEVEPLLHAGSRGECPRSMHPGTEGCQACHPPAAELIANPSVEVVRSGGPLPGGFA